MQDNPRKYACENCYQTKWKPEQIKTLQAAEARKQKEKQRICCKCHEFLTDLDDRITDDDGLRYHRKCWEAKTVPQHMLPSMITHNLPRKKLQIDTESAELNPYFVLI